MLHLSKDTDKIVSIIQQYRETNDLKYRSDLLSQCWDSLQKMARHFYNIYRFYPIEDYEYYMIEAFIDVLEKYDVSRNNKFSTYFYHRARGTVLDHLKVDMRRQNKIKFLSLDKEYEGKSQNAFTMHDVVGDCRYISEHQLIAKEHYEETYGQDQKRYKEILKKLPDGRVKDVFRLKFLKNKSLDYISNELEMTKNGVASLLYYVKKQYLPHHVRSYKNAHCCQKHSYDELIDFAMNQHERDLLQLYFKDKLSMQNVSKKLGCTLQTAYYHLRKIKDRLRKSKSE